MMLVSAYLVDIGGWGVCVVVMLWDATVLTKKNNEAILTLLML
jgi:hypothetical protein